jgi:small subunit ribosomal protein S4
LPGKAPGVRRMRESEYSQLMKSRQTVRFYYGLKEGKFKSLYDASAKSKGSTGDNLLQSLELRLDNVVYRAGFACTRSQARQVVSHGHVLINGKRLNIPSYRCPIGDVVEITEKRKKMELIQLAIELAKQKESQSWIDVDYEKLSVKVSEARALEQLHEMFKISHVIELYSK